MKTLKITVVFILINLAACSVVTKSTSALLKNSPSSLYEDRDYNKISMRIYRNETQNEFRGEMHRFLENKSIGEKTWSTNCDCL